MWWRKLSADSEHADLAAARDDAHRPHRAHGIALAARRRAEGGEVVLAPERRRGAPPSRPRRARGHVPGEAPRRNGDGTRSVDQEIRVALAAGPRGARRTRRARPERAEHADVPRETRIERGHGDGRRERFPGRDARHLAERVDARVGPARPDHLARLALDQRAQRLEQRAPAPSAPRLDLPAVVVGAVVGQQEGQPRGGRLGIDRAYRPGAAPRISSAICTPLSRRPLAELVAHHPEVEPRSAGRGPRGSRPTKQSSWPSTVTGMG